MDYLNAFRNLKSNNKFNRKSPHKAVLLLSIIDMFESCAISDNEIRYDDTLRSTFLKVWNKVLPNEATFLPEAYLPFWFMQSEGFWHIVPVRGKEDIINLMRDTHVKPSESKLLDCVNYAELDEDLYFLMTLQSGRSSLKRALLETYTTLSPRSIDRMSASEDNFVDNYAIALNEYESFMGTSSKDNDSRVNEIYKDAEKKFYALNEDIQYVLCIEYYKFLKEHINERKLFKEICPSVFELHEKITENAFRPGDLIPSFSFTYENFLADLKIKLMGEDGSSDLIDSINSAIDCLHEQELNIIDYSYEKKGPVTLDKENGHSINVDSIENEMNEFIVNNVQKPIHKNNPIDFFVENTTNRCSIFNSKGERVYSTTGKLKIFNNKVYRFNYKNVCFTVKDIKLTVDGWDKGAKKLVAYSDSNLYPLLDRHNFIDQIEDFVEAEQMQFNKISVNGKWYSFTGKYLGVNSSTVKSIETENETKIITVPRLSANYVPKGKLKDFREVVESSYDYFWLLAIIDFMGEKHHSSSLRFDELGCMMIANAWTLLGANPSLRNKEKTLVNCIEFLIQESKGHMEKELNWESSKEEVYDAINEYPMAAAFEDAVDEILENSPYNILKVWIKENDERDFVMSSLE
ncbi:MAG: hypothetical protein K2K25_02640, partial [Muribaculaceae bacterium]|nr:hypothetical protein [Muribaculaceae bacterium]